MARARTWLGAVAPGLAWAVRAGPLRNTRRAALYALANIGDPSAAEVLAKSAQAKSPFVRAKATTCYLLLAQRLAEAGHREQCAKICRDLIKTRTGSRETNVQCAALKTLVAATGKDALFPVRGFGSPGGPVGQKLG